MPRIPIEACNEDGEQVRSFEVDGKEYPDSRPMEIPVGASRPDTLTDIMKRLVHRELSQIAADAGAETFDEAGDFDVEDDPIDPKTPWEALFDPAPEQGGTDKRPSEAAVKPPESPSPAAPFPSDQTVSGGSSGSAAPSSSAQMPTPAVVRPSGT